MLKIRLPVAGADREVDRSERMASVRCAKKIVLALSSGDRSIWLWMRMYGMLSTQLSSLWRG